MPRTILVVEDNLELARLLEIHLRDLSYEVELALDGDSGLAKTEGRKYDLIILDIMLPGIDGLEICRRVRSRDTYTPILMLTSRSSELDRVLGLEMGADDYVTKPFSIRELMARVKALFRRVDELKSKRQENKPAIVKAKDLVIDTEKRRVSTPPFCAASWKSFQPFAAIGCGLGVWSRGLRTHGEFAHKSFARKD
jgi:DNA-binding response OmpR family regulator